MCAECPTVASPWTGALDQDALRGLCEAMNLAEEVSITIDDEALDGRNSNGCYDLRESFERGKHVIFMCSNLTPERANEVLVHELGHARQAEILGFNEKGLLAMQDLYLSDSGHTVLERMADMAVRLFADRFSVTLADEMAVAA